MAKMFYSASEAADRLGKTEDELTDLVKQGTLREFRDGGQVHYKVEDVDALAGPSASASGEIVLEPAEDSGIELSPSGSDVLSLGDVDADDTAVGADTGQKKKKGDTVVPSVGVNVFDDDELDEVVDPLAQTAVTDVAGLGVEGIGSGSGILDLTRESDDTSLGAELLDEIYAGDEGGGTVEMGEDTRAGLDDAIPELPDAGPGGFGEAEVAPVGASADAGPAAAAAPVMRRVVEVQGDAASAGMTAVLFVSMLVLLFAGLGAASLVRGVEPGILKAVYSSLPLYAGAASGVAVLAGVVTWLLARRSGS